MPIEDVEFDQLVDAARLLIVPGERYILGIAGPPGAGKSSLAMALVAALGAEAVLVGLDGFHLANTELHRLGRHHRKGAADTFDPAGYIALLRRLRSRQDGVVYAPVFDRHSESAIAGAQAVPREIALVVTEGNYLLLDDQEWAPLRELLDECWYLEPGEQLRLKWLVARHQAFGRSLEDARQRSYGSDQRNAELIARTRYRADRILRIPSTTA